MNERIKRPELLSPAGNFEKLKAALLYGADAVYLAGQSFGMRSAADNFTVEELYEAAKYTHERGKKLYLTLNTMPHGDEYPALREFLRAIGGAGIDAVIVADLGVMATVKEILPEMEIHVSTQASIVSPEAALAYAALGAKRLVLARELCLDEIKAIKNALPEGIELEAFVHGSMCVSYSGRCMLSNLMTERDANRGRCAQPCRWNYTYTITEEKLAVLRKHGFVRGSVADTCPDCYTVEQFAQDNPDGTFVIKSDNHVATIIDGNLFDAWDSSQRTPLWFWKKK